MREIIKLGLILLIITSIAGLILGVTNDVTQGIIQERALEETRQALVALLPEAEDFNVLEDEELLDRRLILEVFEGLTAGETVGYTVKVNPQGYDGRIEMLVGISSEGRITGVKIGDNTETPGLGSKIADASFTNQFLDKPTDDEFIVTKGGESGAQYIEAISGATVSSEAVVEGVNAVRSLFEELLKNR
ncbi:RnfABCDGE type electron transport complex subunit G [Natronincola ferrireducens]|uniref:Ion-translocating oxidoreductase complex subunit G n=1 Tax=Natronincola ferrireducens TaxID=393762 RepID=A0A1G9D3Z6_9FIRM|nr:RnfABCDGE type electron transport complex subunit G [Natronincola ferrireducens]SDK58652.1 electron transport complex protein RnfG [Natronincola ferrireducens]